jgi:acyl-CoA reductase-like NAD-dependent aldehyde dehydrogenase
VYPKTTSKSKETMVSVDTISLKIPDREGIFVDNAWTESDSTSWLEIVDPSYGEVVARVREATTADVDRAVASARTALETWSRTSPEERADVLDRIADGISARAAEFGELSTLEMGLPIAYGRHSAQMAVNSLRYYADLARTYAFREDRPRPDGGITRILQEPVGVVAAIAPWNGPVPVAGMKMAPALAAGCTVVLKPAPSTPLATYLIGDVLAEAGVPAGIVNILAADREVSEYLAAHEGIDKISFTGSTAAGKRLMAVASERLARVTLELGGKSAAIVCDDIPIEAVLPSLVPGGCGNTGQVCFALTRVLVSEERHDELVAGMKAEFEAIKIGDAHDPATQMGPLAMEAQLNRVESYIQLAREEGATIVTGGGRPEGLDRGYFIQPTLITDVDNSMRVAREEVFGPVICVIRYRDIDDAIRIANDTFYGLGGAVYAGDEERGFEIAQRIRTGTVSVNTFFAYDGTAPFGGYKCSGQGREGGPEGLRPFLEYKSVYMALPPVTETPPVPEF